MTYTVKDFKVSDFKDPNDNTAVNVAFEEFGEPVTWLVKDPSKVSKGMTVEGDIKEQTSRAGKQYNRFYRAKPQDGQYSGGSQQRGGTKREYQPRDDSAIQAQWAIGQANQQVISGIVENDMLEELAKDFFDMIERVKNRDTPEEDKHLTEEQKQIVAEVPNAEKHVELSEIPF